MGSNAKLVARCGDLYLLKENETAIIVDVETEPPARVADGIPFAAVLNHGNWESVQHDSEIAAGLLLVPPL